ncbi:MAG: hypothetical protein ACJASQ_003478 [Crocinitomicaceae bacterium]|jgi:hypothetical protein
MKQLLLTFFTVLALNSHSQTTYVPDDNFEAYLESNMMGNGIPNDDYVTTANISSVLSVNVTNLSISNLTGIEDFTALTSLVCSDNLLTSIDVTQNTALTTLWCNNNQLTSLDVSQNLSLDDLWCSINPLTSLNVTQNTALIDLWCSENQLSTLDLTQNTALIELSCSTNSFTTLNLSQNSTLTNLYCGYNSLTTLNLFQNTALTDLYCSDNFLTALDLSLHSGLTYLVCDNNQLTCLNVKNGNNNNVVDFNATANPALTCIEVDDMAYSTTNWTNVDGAASFSTSCANDCSVGIAELNSSPKQLLKIVDLMGRETTYKLNTVLIYVYDDGTTERVFKLD